MKRLLCLLCLLTGFFGTGRAQEENFGVLVGETEIEALDISQVERLEHLLAHPLRINELSRSRLLSSGLFSRYQVATLLDWRENEGDILSAGELALVDGFGRRQAELLAPFLSFVSDRLPGQSRRKPELQAEMTLRGAWRGGDGSGGGRLTLSREDRWEAGVAARTVYGERLDWPPSGRAAYVAVYRRRFRVILGDFQARFGQGLALWSGFSLSGIASPAAAIRRPSGLSVCRSYAGSGFRGIAADLESGRWTFSGLAAHGGPAAGNIAWFGRYGQVSATALYRPDATGRISLDGRFCRSGTDLFAEVARDLSSGLTAAVGGVILPVGEGGRLAVVARHYPTGYLAMDAGAVRSGTKVSDETGAAVAFSHVRWTASLDAAWHPSKRQGQVKLLSAGTLLQRGAWAWKYRIAGRYRSAEPRCRMGLRSDLLWQQGPWLVTGRIETAYSRKTGLLGYAEAGWKGLKGQLWVRGTVFRIDDWESRIYAYERNAPGNFSVPAYYGRGCEGALYAGRKGRKWAAWLQASLLCRKEKPGRAGLKLQVQRTW